MLNVEYVRLEERVARLERQNRAFRRLSIVAVVAVGSVALLGAAGGTPTTIEAQEFILKDSAGHIRARLGLSSELQAPPVSPSPSPATARDPMPLLDRERVSPPPAPREVSTACLTFLSPRGSASAQQCSSFDDDASSSLAFRSGHHAQVLLAADAATSTLRLGETRSRSNPDGRGVYVTLGAFIDDAGILVKGRSNSASLKSDTLTIDREGRTILVLPVSKTRPR